MVERSANLDLPRGIAAEGLLRHAHRCIAVTVVGLLLRKLLRRNVVTGRHQLFVPFASSNRVTLHRIVVHLAQMLLILQFGAMGGSAFRPLLLLVAGVHID